MDQISINSTHADPAATGKPIAADGMRIIELRAENLKRLKAVTIRPADPLVKITGRNGAGKSSVLDAIWMALGGAGAVPEQPIRQGEQRALVTLDLGDFRVTRRFTHGGTTLTVEDAHGARWKSPQAILDALVGKLCFDPMQFMRMDRKAQFKELLGTVNLPLDLDALDLERKRIFEERTGRNRRTKALEAQIAGFDLPEDAPTEEIGVAELAQALQSAIAANQANAEERRRLDTLRSEYGAAKRKVEELETALAEARRLAETLAEQGRTEKRRVEALADADTEALQSRLLGAETHNAMARQAQRRRELGGELETLAREATARTDRLEAIERDQAEALAGATFPVPGLGLDLEAGTVTYRGLPLDQASAAEQLRVAVGIAMAANPTLRVLRIADGSLLDSASLALIEELAVAHGFQVWIEIVDESGRVGVVIEDGEVVEAETLDPKRRTA